MDFNVTVPTTQAYTVKIRYANGTGANSTHNLCYNGLPCSTVTYPATAGWGQFQIVSVNVNLTAGTNIIRLAKGTTGYAELDNIEITPYLKAEAEDGEVSHAIFNPSSNASNGKFIGGIDYSDSFVDFHVSVPTTRTYTMTIRYANGTGANATQSLAYNGGPWSIVTFAPTAGWGQFQTTTVSVNLTAGTNIIRLAKGTVGFAELDYIELT